MDSNSITVRLCVSGTEAEFRHELADASRLYAEAWNVAQSDYERCIAAHYVGHLEPDPDQRLNWHRRALAFAERCELSQVAQFYGSLYACLARTLLMLDRADEASKFIALAREHHFEVLVGDALDQHHPGRDR